MIRYALACVNDHPFEAWFGESADYDDQAVRGLIECPFCASTAVRKQIMSPAVAGTKRRARSNEPAPVEAPAAPSPQLQSMMLEAAGRMRAHVEKTFDYVGDTFAREARDIHEGAAEERGIYGEATPREVRDLLADGVKVAPMPAAITPAPKDKLN